MNVNNIENGMKATFGIAPKVKANKTNPQETTITAVIDKPITKDQLLKLTDLTYGLKNDISLKRSGAGISISVTCLE